MTEQRNQDAALPPDLVARLPREAAIDAGAESALVDALRQQGMLPQRRRWSTPVFLAAAALAMFATGVWVGGSQARRGSLEVMLDRKDLSLSDRVLLMQRAGSAYVRSAQQYADAVAGVDAVAVEVSSRVLVSAAQAVAKKGLDGGITPRLVSLLETANTKPPAERQ